MCTRMYGVGGIKDEGDWASLPEESPANRKTSQAPAVSSWGQDIQVRLRRWREEGWIPEQGGVKGARSQPVGGAWKFSGGRRKNFERLREGREAERKGEKNWVCRGLEVGIWARAGI